MVPRRGCHGEKSKQGRANPNSTPFPEGVVVVVTVIYINPGAHPMSLETENRGCCRGLLQSEYKIQQEK